jgi:hypothetical protein
MSIRTMSPYLALCLALAFAVPNRATAGPAQDQPTSVSYEAFSYFVENDGKGPFVHNVDDTLCTIDSTPNNGGGYGRHFCQLNTSRQGTVKRTAYTNLNSPYQGLPLGAGTVSWARMQVWDIWTMQVGQTKLGTAYFRVILNGHEYKIRFAEEPNDGSSAVEITRISATEWRAKTLPGADIALVQELITYKDPLVFKGFYHFPFEGTIKILP